MSDPANSYSRNGSEIAIIGITGRFPGARNVEQFWENLQSGVESISFFTDEELLSSGTDATALSNPNFVKAGARLEDIEFFDASFFGFNPREAEITDPQHRLFLECAWEALERAGYDSGTYKGSIGVYAGASLSSYLLNIYLNPNLTDSIDYFQLGIGGDKDFLTTRVSYKLNLEGPSYSIQTACSTSLVAVHLACQSLLSGECDLALAGGVSISASRKAGYFYKEGGTKSPDGHCRAFDAKAQGMVSGEGVGTVVLKRLEDALTDGDSIDAVIKGSAVNNDGAFKVSYTAPRIGSQAKVIQTAQIVAEVEPETIAYIEAHGTGTSLGDPIEIAALTQAFGTSTDKKGFCAIGSLKTNIGHLDAAAGVAGLIKTVLALKYKQIPPSLHFEEPNPQIDFANSPFYVNTALSEWKTKGTPRRAGVSSFGIGGTNAHIIIEEAPTVEPSSPSRPWQLLLLSAKTSSALETATTNLADYLRQHPHLNLADVAHTLQVGRRAFDHRRMLICQDVDDAVKALAPLDSQRVFTQYQEPYHRSVAFMFSGQGAQYVNMGWELYHSEPTFAKQVDYCCELLKPHLELDLRTILYPSEAQVQAAAQQLTQTEITQPALFVIEYALAQLWMEWGIHPEVMIGHSIGEYVAACLAGVFSLEDAIALVATRGRLMQRLPSGAMLSVRLSEPEVQPLLGEELSLAGSNAPSACVISGPSKAVERLQQELQAKGVSCRWLHTSHAFHSPMMDPIVEPFIQSLRTVKLSPPQIPFISNVTGTWITAAEATDPSYWAKHLRQPVYFSKGIAELLQESGRILLEVGPGRTLSTFAKQHQIDDLVALTSIRHPQEQQSDVAFLLNSLGQLWLAGVPVDWSGFYAREQRHHLPLPTYPFERQRYWLEPPAQANSASNRSTKLDKKPNIADWFYVPSWKRSLLPVQARGALKAKQKSCWLVFIDAVGIGSKTAKQLELGGQDVITVTVGEQFTQLSNCAYAINPQQREDYDALLKALSARDLIPNAIAHLWSLTPNQQAQSSNQFFEECQKMGFYSLISLAQALGEQEITCPLQILVVTNNVHEVNGDERLCPEKATVLGTCKSIPQEYPNITCRCIDVVIPELGTSQENQIIDRLIAELTFEQSENVVAYRGKHRWVQTFEPVQLSEVSEGTIPLRKKGVYLITGGLGGIGLVLAEHLARTVHAKLILTGRSSLPPKEEWFQWLETHDEKDEVSRKIKKVQALEALGAEVLLCRADVANFEQMQAAMAEASECFGQVDGVIHAAGIKLYRTVQQISQTECESQLRSTGYGLFVLERVLQGKELDFCLLISSLASVLGVLGMAAYPAAHLFTDAFAYKHNQTSPVPWLSMNCDNWLTQESSELMTASKGRDFAMMRQEGVEAFQRVLSMGKVTQVVISTADLQARIEKWTKPEPLPDSKLTKKATPSSSYSRPNLQNTYVAPRNEVEQTLANIWQKLLGIEQVGIHDNFFELGGDSVLGIQVSAKAARAGFRLTPQQLFEYQTIAELGVVANTDQTIQAEQGLVVGPLPLTPIQQWFFEQNQPEPHHWNQAVLLEALQVLDPYLLEQALQQLLVHHDGLRLRFMPSEHGWHQTNASPDGKVPFTWMDLSAVPLDAQKSAMEAAATDLQASLNLSEGPIVRIALFELGASRSSRLLFIIHHLAVDFGSWRILFEDLQTAYQQLSQGEAIQLPQKTTSFKQWSERLREYAHSPELQQEWDYWLSEPNRQQTRLPVDYPTGVNTVASAQTVSVTLSAEETQILLQEVQAIYRTQTEEVLLAALAQAFAQWTGVNSLLVNLEGNGRESFVDVDPSRTVGWFTTIFPVLLNLGETDNLGEALKAVKEQLRRISHNGIGYGVLRYLSGDAVITEKLQALSQAEVIFLYLGQFSKSLPQSSLFKTTREFSGLERSSRGTRPHLLEVTGSVAEGQLRLDWTYSKNVHKRDTVENLSQAFVKALRSLITHLQSPKTPGYTPSDFPLAKLDQQNLDKLMAGEQQIEDIYPLSPLQQGLLFHSFSASSSEIYISQFSCTLYGNLNVSALNQSLQRLIDRHPIFRTAFVWENLEQPLQIVRQRVHLPWQQHDWQELSSTEQQAQLESLLQADRMQGFILSQAPLMRVILIQLAENTYQFIWSCHHILLDGWSMALVFKEVFTIYEALCQDQNIFLAPSRPYRDYIAWLQQQNLSQAQPFWEQMLKGFTAPTPLGLDRANGKKADSERGYDTQTVQLSAATTAVLQSVAQKHQLTLNTIIQGTWALLLHHYSSERDVVFGATSSGRPTNLAGAESMVGLFINTLPVRVQVSLPEFFLPWLKQIQAQQIEARQYEYSPLAQIQRWSDLPYGAPLFESIVVFENYPIDSSLHKQNNNLEIRNVRSVISNSYPLTLRALPRAELSLQIMYDRYCFDTASIIQRLRQIETLLSQIANDPNVRLSQLAEISTQVDRQQQLVKEKELEETSRSNFQKVKRKPIRKVSE
jgi:non-ribosomal peptide synthase protein (TIGR01720 family)